MIGPQGVCEEARVTATHEGRWLEHEPTGERLEWRNAIFFPWDPAAKFKGEMVYTDAGPRPENGSGRAGVRTEAAPQSGQYLLLALCVLALRHVPRAIHRDHFPVRHPPWSWTSSSSGRRAPRRLRSAR